MYQQAVENELDVKLSIYSLIMAENFVIQTLIITYRVKEFKEDLQFHTLQNKMEYRKGKTEL